MKHLYILLLLLVLTACDSGRDARLGEEHVRRNRAAARYEAELDYHRYEITQMHLQENRYPQAFLLDTRTGRVWWWNLEGFTEVTPAPPDLSSNMPAGAPPTNSFTDLIPSK